MKSRKTRMFVALGLLAISSFSLMTISFADEYKDIQLNPNNAIQTIPTVVFKPSLDSNDKVELQNVRGKRLIQVVTNNNNFILSKNGSSKAVNSTSSSILGGDDNVLNNSNYSTIIAGEGNQINNSSHGVIGGGSGNTVIGNYGTVAGGEGNTANAYGVAVGGKLNAANGSNSVAIGYNAKANGSNSVAMGKNVTVDGNNSFLWSDGTLGDNTLASNNTFAVVGASGMVVNETKAHRFAKLTIGGSLIVRENKAVACGPDHPETIGVLKVVNRDDASNHVCFCSCDGKKWNSLFVGGACSAKCDDAFVEPQCNPSGVTKNCEGSIISYSGGCLVGNLVEGNGAFLVDNNGKLHWTCQTENGLQVQCSGDIPAKDCNDPKGHGVCTGEPENAIFVKSTDIKDKPGEYDNLGPTLYNKLSDVPANAKCAWYCSGGFYMEPGFSYCHKNRPCDPQTFEGYSVPFLEDTQEQVVTKPGDSVLYGTRTCTNTVVCNNKELSLKGTDVCPITCNAGFDYDEASGRCYQNGVCGDEHYTCEKGTLGTTSYSEATHSWTWTCLGINGGSDNLTCSKAEDIDGVCGSEYRTCTQGDVVSATDDESKWLWTCKGYNGGDNTPCTKNKPCVERTCPAGVYTLSTCPAGANCVECTPVDARCNNGTKVYSLNSCPCGYYKNGDSCVACGAKKYSSAGASSCSTAAVGYYANSSCSQTACTNKPDNAHYTSNATSNSCDWACDSGYTKSGDTCVANPTTYTCAAGKYLPKNSTTCSTCPCGNYCPGGTWTKSTTADQGKYGCTSGKYSAAGASSCSSCPSGQQPNSTQCSCEATPDPTYTCAAGKYLPKNSTTCSTCPCGYYCPGGTWTKSTTADQGKFECGAGKWSSAGATSSNSCGNISCGYYGTNACSATPSGQTCTSSNISYSTAGSSSCSSCQNPNVANATHCGCRPSSYGSCDLSEPYGCGDGNTLNETDTTSSTEWEWYCKGEDDTGNGQYCHKGCPEGKTLKWNDLHDGECVASCTPKTCRDYDGYSSSSAGHCVNTVSKSDGCGGTLTCYKNGCQANGYGGYACIPGTQIPNACNDAGGKKDVQNMQDGYACVSCNGVTNSCEWPYVSNISECYHDGTQYDNTTKLPNGCYLCICPSCAIKTDSSLYASHIAGTCTQGGHVATNPQNLLPQNSGTEPVYCAWCDDCSQKKCPDGYSTEVTSCPNGYTLQTNGYLSTWSYYGEEKHYCGKCVGNQTINRSINVFFSTTPCDGAYIMDFVGSDGKTYSVRPDGCDDSIVETNCRFTVNNLPINMTSGNLRRKRMSNVNGGWIDCQDHGGTNLRYFDFNDFSYSEPDIDI